ncbi:MAG: oligosaccharide flippase family protein [Bacteroidales bacterium]
MEISSEQHRKTQYKDLLKYTGLFGGMQGLNLLSTLVRNKLSALLLGPAGLGVISLFVSVITMLNNATNLGISFSGVRHLSEIAGEADNQRVTAYINVIRFWGVVTAVAGSVLCFFLAPFLSEWSFESTQYTAGFRLVSPVVGLTALTGAELAILKGVRRLKEVALSTLFATFLSLFIVIPLYYFYREAAIVPALIIISLLTFGATACFSFRFYPWRRTLFSRASFRQGGPLIRLGVSFIIAGTFGALAEYLIRMFIVAQGSVADVGFYNTGVVLCVSYMGMVFVAIDNDYFSRLSAIHKERERLNELVNQQIELSVMLIAPLIAGLLVFLPMVIRLLYSDDFLTTIPMVEWAWLFVFLKGFNLSLAYIALAKGDSRTFLAIELICHLIYIAMGFAGFHFAGLAGIGMAMSGSALCETLILSGCAYRKYRFRFTGRLLRVVMLYMPFLLFAFFLTSAGRGWIYWISGTFSVGVCSLLSVYLLNKRTGLLQSLRDRFNLKK